VGPKPSLGGVLHRPTLRRGKGITNIRKVVRRDIGVGIDIESVDELKNNRWWVLSGLDENLDEEVGSCDRLVVQGHDIVANGEFTKRKCNKHKKNRSQREVKEKSKQNSRTGEAAKLSCFYANARSIMNKRDELELYISEEKPDIIGVTETWAVEDVEDSELSLEF
jgi:hypothetical protein